jgi:hypothetical protein
MAEPHEDASRPDPEMPRGEGARPEEVEAQPYDRAADEASGARVHEAGSPASEQATGGSSNAWAMACHLAGLADFANILFGLGILLPLAIWLAFRDSDPFIDRHGKEAVNFQINLLLWTLVFGALSCCLIGIPFLVALPVVETVLVILAAIEAAGGRPYRYPLTIRVIP